MARLVQIARGSERSVALVQEPRLQLLEGVNTVYQLAQRCILESSSLTLRAEELATADSVLYDEVYAGIGGWRLLTPVDVPGAPERMLISGTGLTHLGSAKHRQAMHLQTAHDTQQPVTDSMRMFEWGLQNGRPEEGVAGIAPEWFYKGNGHAIQAPFAPLTVPAHAEDGGEEAEIAGIYIVAEDGTPVRIGMCAGNEFSDHKFERRNYLNLAGSKLRACAIGPELVTNPNFKDVKGSAQIERNGAVIWQKPVESGDANMAHSLRNLEHHHFKFEGHRVPGQLHVHFFGAHSLSFGEGVELEDGDMMQVQFDGFGRPLRNPVRVENKVRNTVFQVSVLN